MNDIASLKNENIFDSILMKPFLKFLIVWILINACVDRLYMDIPVSYVNDLVVEGVITNEPGPYTVTLSRVINIKNDDIRPPVPVNAKSVTIYDDKGDSEILEPAGDGTYQTKSGRIQGEIGREYHIRIEMYDGSIFESTPDK